VNIIWTGSDDGLVHLTRDGGTTWRNVTPPEMPDFGRVSQIDASKFAAGTAYISVRRPLLNDLAPYIFKTTDFGRTWTKIVSGIRADDYVHSVREDPTRRGLLYAGTQHGVYISYDDGASWQSLSLNLPDVPIADLIVEGNELVIGTHGRGFWVLDNIAPLRQYNAALVNAETHLFTPPNAVRSGPAVSISYWLKSAPTTAKLEILDSAGTVLRTYEPDTMKVDSLPPNATAADSARIDSMRTAAAQARQVTGVPMPLRAGLNQLAWDLRVQGVERFPGMILWGASTNGPAVPPGRYRVRLTSDGRVQTTAIAVRRNPRITDVTEADLRAQYAFSKRVRDRATEANRAVIAIRRVKAQLENRLQQSRDATLATAGATLKTNASAVEENIYQVRNQSGQDPLNFPIKVNNRLANLMSMAERGDGRPTNNMPEIFAILSRELGGYLTRLDEVWRTDLAAVNRELARLRLERIDPRCALLQGCTVVQ
jgi:hypothetical protein